MKQVLCSWKEVYYEGGYSHTAFIVDGKIAGTYASNQRGPYADDTTGIFHARYNISPIGEYCIEKGLRLFDAATLREIYESREENRERVKREILSRFGNFNGS